MRRKGKECFFGEKVILSPLPSSYTSSLHFALTSLRLPFFLLFPLSTLHSLYIHSIHLLQTRFSSVGVSNYIRLSSIQSLDSCPLYVLYVGCVVVSVPRFVSLFHSLSSVYPCSVWYSALLVCLRFEGCSLCLWSDAFGCCRLWFCVPMTFLVDVLKSGF
jgi:hypothetical protein